MSDMLATFKALFGRKARPADPPDLASVAHVRQNVDSRVTDSLGPEKLASILRAAREGEMVAYLELAEAMEERDLHYYSLLQTRKLAVTGATWVVDALEAAKTRGKADKSKPVTGQASSATGGTSKASASDEEIASALLEEVIETPAFRFWCADALDAIAKGFAVSQPVWDTSGRVGGRWQYKEFRRVDPRCFRFMWPNLTELMQRDSTHINGMREPDPGLVVHYPRLRASVPVRGGLAMLAAVTWMFKNFTIKDWMAFCEVYGMPLKVGKYPAGSTTLDEQAALRRALSNVGHDAALLIPDSVEIEIEAGRAGTSPYEGLAEYFDKQLSKGILGQTMTSDDGSSLAQAAEHTKVRIAYAKADGFNLAATAQAQIFAPWVALNFGPDARVPWAYPSVDEPEDIKAWSEAVTPMILAGLKVPAKFARGKFGIPEPEAGEELIEQPAPEPVAGAVPGKPGAAKPAAKPKIAPNAEAVEAADEIVDGVLTDWEPVLVEWKDTIEALGAEATSYEHFLELLDQFTKHTDSNPFVRKLAIAAAEARLLAESAEGQAEA